LALPPVFLQLESAALEAGFAFDTILIFLFFFSLLLLKLLQVAREMIPKAWI
jgi:hypothetical protein